MSEEVRLKLRQCILKVGPSQIDGDTYHITCEDPDMIIRPCSVSCLDALNECVVKAAETK